VGRPKIPLARATHRITARVRAIVHLAHRGNLAEASRATGIPHPTLRELYVGRTVNPSLATLDRLAATYGVSIDWFRSPEEPEEAPLLGRRGFLPSLPTAERARPQLREILIPFAAWPMYDVVARLSERLGAAPLAPERPIVGEATGEAFQFRLCTFLFQPLLAAERAGESGVILAYEDAAALLDTPRGHMWVQTLSALGELWRAALGQLLSEPVGATRTSS
jgi:transcriptional regulator with XRE-family HTH domain